MQSAMNEKQLDEMRAFDTFFQNQQSILAGLATLSLALNKDSRLNSIYPLIDSIQTSAHAISALLRQGLITESYILSRAYLERIVNACYLLVCDQSAFDNYVEYSMQKVQRATGTRRMAYAAIGKEIVTPDFSKIPIVAKGLKKFTSVRGKEITRWSTLNVEKRIEFIQQRNEEFNSKLFLAISRFIYEDASEAVHGTLYGALFHSGIFSGMKNPENGEAYLNSTRKTLYMLLGLLKEGLFVVATQYGSTETFVSQSQENYSDLQKYFNNKST